MIDVFRPDIGDREIAAVTEVLRSGWLGAGPRTAEFERRFAAFCHARYAVGVSSATAALDLSLRLLGIGEGAEVIVPTTTFVSTGHCVAYNRAVPVFADVEPSTLNLDPKDVERRLTPRTRAVIAVHYAGRPADLDGLRQVVGDLPIIEDCAHAAGARYKGRPVGGLGAIGCFSFQAVKNIAMGDGGALVLHDRKRCERARRLRWLGIDRSTWERAGLDEASWWRYDVSEIGLKCQMNDIAASLGLVQLERLPETNGRRRRIVERYRAGLADLPVELPPEDEAAFQSSWHIFHIKTDRRDPLSAFLQERGIATGVHYTPIHTYRCYGEQPRLPVAEALQERILTLPLHPRLGDDQVDYVIDSVRTFLCG